MVVDRFWNSEKLGLLYGHAWEAVMLTAIPYNINDGPWHGAGFLGQLSRCKNEYTSCTKPGDSKLLAALLPKIAKDQGREADLGKDTYIHEVWNQVKDFK